MDFLKIKAKLLEKVDDLEYQRNLQQHYIKNQFSVGRQKGAEDRQKIKKAINNLRPKIDYSWLAVIFLLLVVLEPVIFAYYFPKLFWIAVVTEIILSGISIWAFHSHLVDTNKKEMK